MAAADKARFYLERSVPELQELGRKEVFTPEEIQAIVKKRSDFEHVLNSPGPKPNDYLRYAAYEMNLDTLRKKRCLRIGVKSTSFNGQRNVFNIFDRATKKFPGDKKMWLQYIQFCQKEHANKKLARVFTSALRLAPRDWTLWVLAAKHYAESQGDMATARGYLQRGIRFCSDESILYVEYAKLELVYLAKLAARRRLLGLDQEAAPEELMPTVPTEEAEDTIALPTITAEEFDQPEDKALEHLNVANLERLAKAPVMQGAVPIAILDAAMQKFGGNPELAKRFFALSLYFDELESISRFQEHIITFLEQRTEPSAELFVCKALQCLGNKSADSADYPVALSQALEEIKRGMSQVPSPQADTLAFEAILLLIRQLQAQGGTLDEDLTKVVVATIRRYVRLLHDPDHGTTLVSIIRDLKSLDSDAEVDILISICGDIDVG